MKKFSLLLSLTLLNLNCLSSKKAQQPQTPQQAPLTHAQNRWKSNFPLNQQIKNVLDSAFNSDYKPTTDNVNAYDFPLYQGQKGMDWWNFPWDLPSTKPEYTLSYQDMKLMLTHVVIKPQKESTQFITYAAMLKQLYKQLTVDIINAHGRALRVVKITYCIRNFLAVAQRHHLTSSILDLKKAAHTMIALAETNKLLTNATRYLIKTTPQQPPRDLDGNKEDRTLTNGIADLKRLVNQ